MRFLVLALLVGCGDNLQAAREPDARESEVALPRRTVFVIAMENTAAANIYGNTVDAPYLNSLMATCAYGTSFRDELPSLPSEPHYIWMEAGTNAFLDHTFLTNAIPSTTNSTSSPDHLAAQLTAAGIAWTSYQEGIVAGTCPIAIDKPNHFAPKHDPFVFFTDVAGNPPSATSPICSAHHKAYADLETDLAAATVDGYVFITPDTCHDMHGAPDCPQGALGPANVKAGDSWLSVELPRIIDYASSHDGAVFITWDEGDGSNLIPLFVLGVRVKPTASANPYSHSSLLKSIELLFGVPVLPTVASANDFADMFDRFP